MNLVGHIQLEHACWNCIYCKDMQNTELEVDDFLCAKDEHNYCKFPLNLICEHWKEEE